MAAAEANPELSIILPCLNEEGAIGACLEEIAAMAKKEHLSTEVVIVDNGSTDRSIEIAISKKSLIPISVINEHRRGYGFACIAGLKAARGKMVFLADADRTYDFNDIPRFISKIKKGFDLVVGNRFAGAMERGAMKWHHGAIGTPALTTLGKLLFGFRIRDINCGARLIRRSSLQNLSLVAGGMEFASEMVIKAHKAGLRIAEIPISYRVRIGESKLEAAGDGWRHLRFMLLYSPLGLFFIPGIALFALGTGSMLLIYFGKLSILDRSLSFHPMFLSSVLMIVGYQTVFFGAFSKTYAVTHLGDTDRSLEPLFRHITIEKAGLAGALAALLGIALYGLVFHRWASGGYGPLDEAKNLVAASTLVALGAQTFFSAFMMSILGIKEK